MSKESRDKLEALLQQVTPSRRELLKRLLIGGGILAVAPSSVVLAQADGEQERRPGKGKHKGWRKGKGTRAGAKERARARARARVRVRARVEARDGAGRQPPTY